MENCFVDALKFSYVLLFPTLQAGVVKFYVKSGLSSSARSRIPLSGNIQYYPRPTSRQEMVQDPVTSIAFPMSGSTVQVRVQVRVIREKLWKLISPKIKRSIPRDAK